MINAIASQVWRSRAVDARAAAGCGYQPTSPHVGGAGLAADAGRRRSVAAVGARDTRSHQYGPTPASYGHQWLATDAEQRSTLAPTASHAAEYRSTSTADARNWPAAAARQPYGVAAVGARNTGTTKYRSATPCIGAQWSAACAAWGSALADGSEAAKHRPTSAVGDRDRAAADAEQQRDLAATARHAAECGPAPTADRAAWLAADPWQRRDLAAHDTATEHRPTPAELGTGGPATRPSASGVVDTVGARNTDCVYATAGQYGSCQRAGSTLPRQRRCAQHRGSPK